MDDVTVALICLLEGASSVFKVNARIHGHVLELKKLIYGKCESDLADSERCDAKDLILFKVDIALSIVIGPGSRLLSSLQVPSSATMLEDGNPISFYWTPLGSPLDKKISIFVRKPPHFKRKLSDDESLNRARSPYRSDGVKRLRTEIQPKDLWLSELHSKIWGKKERRPELVHEIEITAAHYVGLQKLLGELYPERDSSDYMSKDVRSVKLNFLQSSNHLAPTDPLPLQAAADECTEDGYDLDELSSFFPITIQYLDLSRLQLENTPRRIPLPLLIRQEYGIISALLEKRRTDSAGSAIICGQPGIGKTTYLHFQVIENIIAGCPFLYQTIDGDVYHFSEVVTRVTSWSSKKDIVAFVDADTISHEPNNILKDPRIRIIAATSPQGAAQQWSKQYDGFLAKYGTALWSPSELFITGIFLHAEDLTFARLKKSTSYFGFNPRWCFKSSSSAFNLLQCKEEIKTEICSILSTINIRSIVVGSHMPHGLFNLIFEQSPQDDERRLSNCRIGAVSKWALNILLSEYETRQADAAAEFYNSIKGTSFAASLRDRIVERQVLRHLDSIKAPLVFQIRSLKDSSVSEWLYPGPAERFTFVAQTFASALQSAVEAKKSLHLVPEDPNFPSVDSVLYDPDAGLTGIQVTIREDHGVSVIGLKRIQRWLKQGSLLAGLRPSIPGVHWRHIFIVSDAMADSYQEQSFEGDTALGEWSKKIDQYVLGIPENTLWARTAQSL